MVSKTARILAIGVVLLVAATSLAAEVPVPAAPAPPSDTPHGTPATEGVAAPQAAPAAPESTGSPGDVINLKSGRVYRGFQVLSSSSSEVLLEVTPGVTLTIPRRQIVSIDYDTIDPAVEAEKRKAAQEAAAKAATELLSGQKVSPAIQAKLAADISETPIKVTNALIGDVIVQLNKVAQVGGLIEVDKVLRKLPVEQRQWTFETTPGMTLASALENLKKALPNLATVIRDDKLVITDQATARQLLGGDAAATQPGAAPAPGAPAAGQPAPAAPAAPAPGPAGAPPAATAAR